MSPLYQAKFGDMISAHLPAGYLVGRLAARDARILAAVVVGAILPDIDMLWFHLVDHGRTHHHLYPTHWPLFWLALCLPAFALAATAGWRRTARSVLALLAGTWLHLALDTVAAPVFWAMPFAAAPIELIEVPARHGNWLLSFLLHWTFGLELMIWLAAIFLWRQRRQKQTARHDAGPF